MKKVLAFMAAVTVISGTVLADGYINLTTWDSGKPVYYLTSGTLAGGADFYAQVVAGPNNAPVVSTTDGKSVFNITSDGNIDNGTGLVLGVDPLASASVTFRAWKGAATYDAALERGAVTWNQNIGDNPAAPNAPTPASLNIPSSVTIVAVPEPSTIALGLLGAAALLIRRRK